MSELFHTKGAKRAMDKFEAERKEKGIPDSLIDLPLEQMTRIYERIQQETNRAQVTSNPNIKFAKLKAFVHEMVSRGHTFKR